MKAYWNKYFTAKVLLIGALVAMLVYLFHPAEGPFIVMINGERIADPIVQLATLPATLAVLFFTTVLSVLAFLGAGLFIFLGALVLILLGLFIIAPYIWPLLLLVFIIILIMSLSGKKSDGNPSHY